MKAGMLKRPLRLSYADHQTALCRGGADPQTSPPVAYISIDKTSGEISWPDVAEGFAEE
jgi:hypothetical protein